MEWLTSLALAVVQGLTEFLPVSSSGHLRLFAGWFGLEDPQTLYDAVLHGGTLGAVLVVYREPLWKMARSVWRALTGAGTGPRGWSDEHARLVAYVALGSVPTAAIGYTLGSWAEVHLATMGSVGGLLIINGFLLLTTRPRAGEPVRGAAAPPGRGVAELTWRDAVVIGVVQGTAVLRGISRSGSTIAAGLALGLRRDVAALFSFLLSLPAVGGGLLLLLLRARGGPPIAWGPFVVGALVSFLVGVWALRWLLRLVASGTFYRFAPYCWAMGAAAIVWELL